jgi:hypothetical protein
MSTSANWLCWRRSTGRMKEIECLPSMPVRLARQSTRRARLG